MKYLRLYKKMFRLNMAIVPVFYSLALVVTIVGCTDTPETEIEQLEAMISSPESGYTQEASINGVRYVLQLRPSRYVALQYAASNPGTSTTNVDADDSSFEPGLNFVLSIYPDTTDLHPEDSRVLKQWLSDQLLAVMSDLPTMFTLQIGHQTTPAAIAVAEGPMGLTSIPRIVTAFPISLNSLNGVDSVTITFNDRILGLGNSTFRYPSSTLRESLLSDA